jgi:hypothetical protein
VVIILAAVVLNTIVVAAVEIPSVVIAKRL